jgi:uncharacterized protein YbjT (DUF2867 family)
MTTLVMAATGQVGRTVVQELLHDHQPVRVLTRNAARARQLLGDGPELVEGELTDSSVRRTAFRDVSRLFLASGNHPGQVAAESAAIDEARAASVQRIVKLSGPSPSHSSPLVFERWHAQVEDHLWGCGIPACALRPSSFTTNLLAFTGPVARTGVLPAPADGARVAFVDPRDVGSVAATLLRADTLPARRTLRVTGPAAVSYEQAADDLSDILGRPITFRAVSEAEARRSLREAGLPGELVDSLMVVYGLQREGAFAEVTTAVLDILGRRARSVRQVLTDHADLFTSLDVAAASQPAH